jgi:hypothetical protein
MAENTITSFFVALCLVCLWITAIQLLNFLTESSQCYREATRVEDNGCATIKDCIRRAKFIEEDTKRSSHKALRLILFSAVFSVAGMQVGSYIGAVGILWYLETMAEDVSAGSYMSFFPQVLQSRPTRHWCVCYLLSGGLGVAMYMVIAGGYMILLRSLLFA